VGSNTPLGMPAHQNLPEVLFDVQCGISILFLWSQRLQFYFNAIDGISALD
jgi:hypothetical protein